MWDVYGCVRVDGWEEVVCVGVCVRMGEEAQAKWGEKNREVSQSVACDPKQSNRLNRMEETVLTMVSAFLFLDRVTHCSVGRREVSTHHKGDGTILHSSESFPVYHRGQIA